MNTSSLPLENQTPNAFRCNRCGVESVEPSCFGLPEGTTLSAKATTCITCRQGNLADTDRRYAGRLFATIAMPLVFVIGARGSSQFVSPSLVMIALLMLPLIIFLHELGHFLTARVLALESLAVTIGLGGKLWSIRIGDTTFRINRWPLMGMTYMGSSSLSWLRPRLWITVLMGPATNLMLIALAIGCWHPLAKSVGPNVLILWNTFNALLLIGNLLPLYSHTNGVRIPTDGHLILTIPLRKAEELQPFLGAAGLAAALLYWSEEDYVNARDIAQRALLRAPTSMPLKVLIAACHLHTGNYDLAVKDLELLVSDPAAQLPLYRAGIANNLAAAKLFQELHCPQSADALTRADTLSATAYSMYPCMLPYRSTRAILLSATGQAEDALALLDYPNFARGTSDSRAHWHIARAYAFRLLGREAESTEELRKSLKLSKRPPSWLRLLGLHAPASS